MKDESRAWRAKFAAKLFTNRAAYVILLVLIYALGYLSASYPAPPPRTSTATATRSKNSLRVTAGDRFRCPIDEFRVTTRCGDSVPPELVRPTVLDRVYDGESPYDGFPPRHVSKLLRARRVKGWGSNGTVFAHLIERVRPRTIVEVGTFLGASALHMAELTHRLGLETQILCVDDFRGWPGFRDRFRDIGTLNGDVLLMYQFMQNVVTSNRTGSILPVPFSTGSGLEKLCEWGIKGDLIEIDAGHDFNSAWADINRAYRILRPGGVIFGHDYFTAKDNRGVRRAVNLFARINGLNVRADGQHWVIDPVKRA